MKIVETNEKKGIFKLLIEDEEDLWVLYNVIRTGDVVEALTTREVKPGEGGSSRRLPMTLAVEVKELEFQPFSDRLRIKGVVVRGPEDFGVVGRHHTLSVRPGDVVTLLNKKLDELSMELLTETSRKRKVLLASVDYDEACLAILTEQGIRILEEKSLNLPGKNDIEGYEKALTKAIEEISDKIAHYIETQGVDGALIGSPGYLRDAIALAVKQKAPGALIFTDSISYGGCKGIEELVKRGGERQILKEAKIVAAGRAFEEFKERLAKDPDTVSYGLDNVEYAVKSNAVKVLLISGELLKERPAGEADPNSIAVEAFRRGAKVFIVPKSAPFHSELIGFGGAVAVLRFRLPAPGTPLSGC